MRQTLFFLPHQVGPFPLFGWFSWTMAGLVAYVVGYLLLTRHRIPWRTSLQENGWNWGIGALVLGALLPRIEAHAFVGTPDEQVIGLPVRGYGVMLMLGVLAAIAVAQRRVEKHGISRDAFLSLALWTVIGGLVGARLFYVVQKWEELGSGTLSSKLWAALQFTEGGLVVYGSAMGGLMGILIWTLRHRVQPLPLIDAIAPAFFIGLAFGRIGCLFNGCCYGGVCEDPLPSIRFPRGAPAYVEQMESGRLFGLRTQSGTEPPRTIDAVVPESWAAAHGIQPGGRFQRVDVYGVLPSDSTTPLAPPEYEGEMQVEGQRIPLERADFPERSLPVHPSQIYAAISGLLLFLWSWSIPRWLERPGLVFGSALIAYGVLRILEEIIRVDEAGVFGTSLSISQWVSVLGIVLGSALVAYAWRRSNPIQQERASPA
jgi:phosphatidylglycerol:prolipoprotein diacylglycerol transferase